MLGNVNKLSVIHCGHTQFPSSSGSTVSRVARTSVATTSVSRWLGAEFTQSPSASSVSGTYSSRAG